MKRAAPAPQPPAAAPAAAPPAQAPSSSRGFARVTLRVQRQAASPGATAPTSEAAPAPEAASAVAQAAGPPPNPDVPEARADGERLVEDEREPEVGQLTKSEFLRRLNEALDAGLSASLAGSGYTSESCPTLAYWLGFAANLSAARLERGLRLYVGLKQIPAQAEDYLAPMVARVQAGVAHWRATGEVEGVPIEWEAQAAQQEEAFVQSKAEGDRAAAAPDPHAVRAALGHGQPLSGDVRASMEARFGAGFGHVRVHAGARAAEQARRLDARAFTVGRDVGFAAGQFAPGTLRGDLLLAHELAHTLQQGGATGGHARKAERGSDAALERQADRAAAAAFAPELREAAGGRADLDEEALLREAEQAPPVPGGLRLQRCQNGGNSSSSTGSSSSTPATPPKPWWQEAVVPGDTAVLFCRPLSRFTTLVDLLRQVDVQVSRASGEVLKTTPGTKSKDKYIQANLAFTQWTPADVATKLKKLLPMGGSGFLDQATLDGVKKIVSDHRATHPQTFSVLQGIEMASAPNWPTSHANCIATMNKATMALYGPGTIAQMSALGTTVQDSIDAVDKQGLISEKQTFAAKYTGDAKRYQLLDASKDVSFSGAGKWIEDKAMAGEDGVHAFLLSVCNGFHSVSLVAMKGGGKVTIAWKDQIIGIETKTPAEVDAKVAGLCVSRYRFWMRDKYNEKHDPDVAGYDDVKKALSDADLKALEDELKPTVNKDIGINTVAKLKPAKV